MIGYLSILFFNLFGVDFQTQLNYPFFFKTDHLTFQTLLRLDKMGYQTLGF